MVTKNILFILVLLHFAVSAPIYRRRYYRSEEEPTNEEERKVERSVLESEVEESKTLEEVKTSENENKISEERNEVPEYGNGKPEDGVEIPDEEQHSHSNDDSHRHEGITTKMAHFYGEMVGRTETSFTLKLSYDKLPQEVSFYEFVILKLNRDEERIPRLTKTDPKMWQTFVPYTREPSPEHPYIAARFIAAQLPVELTVGDGKHFGGSFNGPLQPGSFYAVFLRGTLRDNAGVIHLVSNYISTLKNPDIPEFFHTETQSNAQILKLGIGLGVAAILTTAIFIGAITNVGIFGRIKYGIVRTKKRKADRDLEYQLLEDTDSSTSGSSSSSGSGDSWSDDDTRKPPVPVRQRQNRRSSRRNTKASEQKSRSRAARHVRNPIKLDPIQESAEPVSPRSVPKDTLKVPSQAGKTVFVRKSRSGSRTPRGGKQTASPKELSSHATSQCPSPRKENLQGKQQGINRYKSSGNLSLMKFDSSSGGDTTPTSSDKKKEVHRHTGSHIAIDRKKTKSDYVIIQIDEEEDWASPRPEVTNTPVPKLNMDKLVTKNNDSDSSTPRKRNLIMIDTPNSNASTPPATFLKTYTVPDSPTEDLQVDTPTLYKGGKNAVAGGSMTFNHQEGKSPVPADRSVDDLKYEGYGSSRDVRESGEHKAALKKRMEAYRWLIRMKQTGKISVGTDIREVLGGKVNLPESVVRQKPAGIDLESLKWDLIGTPDFSKHAGISVYKRKCSKKKVDTANRTFNEEP